MSYFLVVLLTILIKQTVQVAMTQKNMAILNGINSCPDSVPIVTPEKISTMKDRRDIRINGFFILSPLVLIKYSI